MEERKYATDTAVNVAKKVNLNASFNNLYNEMTLYMAHKISFKKIL